MRDTRPCCTSRRIEPLQVTLGSGAALIVFGRCRLRVELHLADGFPSPLFEVERLAIVRREIFLDLGASFRALGLCLGLRRRKFTRCGRFLLVGIALRVRNLGRCLALGLFRLCLVLSLIATRERG